MRDPHPHTEQVRYALLPCANGKHIGCATLDAPQALHALNLSMIRSLDATLQAWASDDNIACVVLQSSTEKAFCAGGDVRALRQAILEHDDTSAPAPSALAFFSEEYRLDFRIHRYPKPLLVWGNGIVMGGGLGLLAGAAQRVVTPSTKIAMPETTLGLFPDVGASYFLPRMAGKLGLFLGLTGAALNAHDALFAGLADHCVPHEEQAAVLAAICQIEWQADAAADRLALENVLRSFALLADELPTSNLRQFEAEIKRLCAAKTLAEVVAAIQAYDGDSAWLQRAASSIAKASPTSLAIAWELQQRAHGLDLAQVFQLELIVAAQCCLHHDFAEGVRALLVDKDQQPQWQTMNATTLQAHFNAPWDRHPLQDLSTEFTKE